MLIDCSFGDLMPEQQLFAETVRRVADERIALVGARVTEDDQFSHDLIDLYGSPAGCH